MNAHQRRKARRQHARAFPWAYTPGEAQAIKEFFSQRPFVPTIADLQQAGHLPTTNQERT